MELEAHPGHPSEPRRCRLIRTSADQSASGLTAITPPRKPQAEIPRASPQGYEESWIWTDEPSGASVTPDTVKPLVMAWAKAVLPTSPCWPMGPTPMSGPRVST